MIEEEKKRAKNDPIPTTNPEVENDVQDIDLGFVEKRKFRIAGDYNRILELNVSDLNIFKRYTVIYPKLENLLKKAQEKSKEIDTDDDSEDSIGQLNKIADILESIDNEMRGLLDELFDSNVSEVCAPSGNMFDFVDGEYRFERIIDKLSVLYTNNLDKEIAKFKSRTAKHTSKYTKKYHN